MQKFKTGDRIVEIATGDKGTITEQCSYPDRWWVDWDDGQHLNIGEDAMKLDTDTDPAPFATTEQALSFLISQGFKSNN